MDRPTWVQVLELVEKEGGYVDAPHWNSEGDLKRVRKISKELNHIDDQNLTNSLTAMFEGDLIDHTAWNPQEIAGNERIYITETGYSMLQNWRSSNQQQQLSKLTVQLTAVLAVTAIIQAISSVLSTDGQFTIDISGTHLAVIPYQFVLMAFYLILGVLFVWWMREIHLL